MKPRDGEIILHLMTQSNQPSGSRRKCCERCGVMVDGTNKTYTHQFWRYDNDKYDPEYVRCVNS